MKFYYVAFLLMTSFLFCPHSFMVLAVGQDAGERKTPC